MKARKRKPTTLYLDPDVLRAVKVKAALNGRSVSDLANQALVRDLQEDARDLELIRRRRGRPTRTYEEVLAGLKRDGLL